jgi:hypothetical protein
MSWPDRKICGTRSAVLNSRERFGRRHKPLLDCNLRPEKGRGAVLVQTKVTCAVAPPASQVGRQGLAAHEEMDCVAPAANAHTHTRSHPSMPAVAPGRGAHAFAPRGSQRTGGGGPGGPRLAPQTGARCEPLGPPSNPVRCIRRDSFPPTGSAEALDTVRRTENEAGPRIEPSTWPPPPRPAADVLQTERGRAGERAGT